MELDTGKVVLTAAGVALSTAAGGIVALFKRVRKLEVVSAQQESVLEALTKSGDARSVMIEKLGDTQQQMLIAMAEIGAGQKAIAERLEVKNG